MFCNHKKLWKRSEQSWLSSLNADSSARMRSISLTLDTSTRRVRHMTGVIIQYFWWVLIDFWLSGLPSTPTINRNSGPSRQALLTFHQELTEPFIDLMAKYSGWPPSYCPRGRPAPGFSGPWLSPWLCPAMPSPPTGEDSGTCACNIVSMEMRRKMRRTRRLLVRRRDISLNKPRGWGGKESHQLGLQTSERRPQQQAWTYSGDVCKHHQHPPTRSDHQRRKAILQDFRAEKQLQS